MYSIEAILITVEKKRNKRPGLSNALQLCSSKVEGTTLQLMFMRSTGCGTYLHEKAVVEHCFQVLGAGEDDRSTHRDENAESRLYGSVTYMYVSI